MSTSGEDTTTYDYLQLSDNAYDDPSSMKIPEGFEIVGTVDGQGNKYGDNFDNGYEANAYYNKDTGELIFAHRGTDSGSDQVQINTAIATGVIPQDQFDSMETFVSDIRNQIENTYGADNIDISHTGHSQGAYWATVAGAHFGDPSVAFDSPATKIAVDKIMRRKWATHPNNQGLDPDVKYNWEEAVELNLMDDVDAISYQSHPNLVNSGGIGGHAGDTIWMHGGMDNHDWTIPSNIDEFNSEAYGTHQMSHIEQYFNPYTGEYNPEAYKNVPDEQFYVDKFEMEEHGLTSLEQLALHREMEALIAERQAQAIVHNDARIQELDAQIQDLREQISADQIRVRDEIHAGAQDSDRAMINSAQNYQFAKVGSKAKELNNLINSWK